MILRDGSEVSGTILCAGQAAVVLLTPDGEQTIPRAAIERVVKNADGSFPKKYKAETLDGHKFLVEAPPESPPGAEDGMIESIESRGGPSPPPRRAGRAGRRPGARPRFPAPSALE
ncbi:MAG: hypothetical protein ACODAJ_03410 [Planctomycetota bacterium]